MQVHGQVTPRHAGDKSNHRRKAYFALEDGHWWFLMKESIPDNLDMGADLDMGANNEKSSDVDSDNDGDVDPDVIDELVYMC